MEMISMGAIPLNGNLSKMLGGGFNESRVMFSPKEFVAWTGLVYLSDTERTDRGWLMVGNRAIATVRTGQLSYKEALSYTLCIEGAHVITFKGDDNIRDGVVSIIVGSVDNLALLTAQGNLPDQVIISSSFTFSKSKLARVAAELKRCGYELMADDNAFRGNQSDWSHAIIDVENSTIVGFLEGAADSEKEKQDPTGIQQLFKRMAVEAGQSVESDDDDQVKMNISTTDVILIEALIDLLSQNEYVREAHA